MTEPWETACNECGREILEPPLNKKSLVWSNFGWRVLEGLRRNGLCLICFEHREGAHQTGFKTNCLSCQLDKKQLAKKLAERLAGQES